MPRSVPLGVVFFVFCAAIECAAADRVDFTRDIRPILSEFCFQCHGPDDGQRKAGLRLDTKDGAFAEHDGIRAFVPEKPDDSEALLRMTSSDPNEQMPPPKFRKRPTAKQIDLVRQWIQEGAAWSTHWAFVSPQRHNVPAVQRREWVRNPLDAFVLSRLEREGLSPSGEADRTTLLRRLSLDLIGLPPTIAEMDAFLADNSANAYEKQIERLLDSPHYGERWARVWLDGARYADSDGYEKDKARRVYFYRDWVVNALNRDLPYDQFIIEQLAGDLLPRPTQDQFVATGFLRNSMINEEGGIDPEQFRMEAMFDRMDAVGKSMLGLTIQCAQCHNHKYDPLTQEEYYRLFAFLNDSHEANIAVYTPEEQMRRANILREIAGIEADLQHRHPQWRDRMTEWVAKVRDDQPEWHVVRPELDASGGQKHYLLADGSVLAAGYAPTKHTTEFTVKTDVSPIRAVRLDLLNDPNLPLGGPGRSLKGLFALSEFKLTVAPADGSAKPKEVKLVRATADVNPPERDLETMFDDKTKKHRTTGPIAFATDGNADTAWTIDVGPGRSNVPRKAVFVLEEPITFEGGAVLTFKLQQNHGGWNSDDNQNNNLGRFRFSITTAEEAAADSLPVEVRDSLDVSPENRTKSQSAAMFSFWRTTVDDWKEANDKIEELWRQHPDGSAQLVLHRQDQPRQTHLLMRGDFLKPAQPVNPGVPSFLHALPGDAPANRLTLARWLTDRNSPTTARSLVNRVWQTYFGTGLVSTSEDFGLQSEVPTHPELLDWLAVEFMEPSSNPKSAPWSLKSLHRLIVTSATYRQSSRSRPELTARDPNNRLLARGPRFRVDAEVVRDIALAASGLLDRTVGGPSVHPPAPEFLFLPPVSYGPKVWREEADGRHRRALYTFQFRSIPYPPLQMFDAPNGDFACVRRPRSNTPLQALTTLNEPVFLEAARGLALRTLREGGKTDEERLTFAFRCCVSRPPSTSESQVLLNLLAVEAQRFSADNAKAAEVLGKMADAQPKVPTGITSADTAAWIVTSRVLLNLDETITKE